MLEGVSKHEPVVENEQGGKQSATPYGMHLIDPEFLNNFYEDVVIKDITDFMKTDDRQCLLEAIISISYTEDYTYEKILLDISKVRKEACEKYHPQNWRRIPQEDHINHALVHYLAYKMQDKQDEHLKHCLCRLMFAYCTERSEGFDYIEREQDEN